MQRHELLFILVVFTCSSAVDAMEGSGLSSGFADSVVVHRGSRVTLRPVVPGPVMVCADDDDDSTIVLLEEPLCEKAQHDDDKELRELLTQKLIKAVTRSGYSLSLFENKYEKPRTFTAKEIKLVAGTREYTDVSHWFEALSLLLTLEIFHVLSSGGCDVFANPFRSYGIMVRVVKAYQAWESVLSYEGYSVLKRDSTINHKMAAMERWAHLPPPAVVTSMMKK